jgi:DNA polymerase III epsilon subunit-like protein
MSNDNIKLPTLKRLSEKIGRPISIFDLETTGFLDDDLSGITEIAWLTVFPSGEIKKTQKFINPECHISEGAAKVSGITESMVENANNFEIEWQEISKICHGHALFGFNSNHFDVPFLQRQIDRYNTENAPEIWTAYDVRVIHQVATKAGQRGTLGAIAKQWGIEIEEDLHRAGADVKITAMLLDAILEEHGFSVLRDRRIRFGVNTPCIMGENFAVMSDGVEKIVMPPKNKQKDLLNWVVTEVGINGYRPISQWSQQMGVNTASLEELIETAVDTGVIDYESVKHEATQRWLFKNNRLQNLLKTVYPSEEKIGKLIYPFQMLDVQLRSEGEAGIVLDYVQLRVAFKALGIDYQTRRKLLEEQAAPQIQETAPVIKKSNRPMSFSA